MILCSCESVSETTIRQHVRRGFTRLPDIVRATGAGSCCGACTCDLRRILAEEQPQEREEPPIAK